MTDRDRIVNALCGEALMSKNQLMDYAQDNNLFSDCAVCLDDVPDTDLVRALNHFRSGMI